MDKERITDSLEMEKASSPLVSIVVITFNQEKCLPATLDSLLEQDCAFPYEIVVCDDCSPDGTRAVIADYAEKHPCIKAFYNEKNLGLVGNYVGALSHCQGKYIAMCDGDDIWNDASKLRRQVEIMEKDASVGLVYTDVIINSVVTGETFVRRCANPKEDLFTQLLKGNILTISTVCFRADLLQYVDLDSFVPNGYRMQDYPMWLEFCHHTRFCRIPEPMVTYLIDHRVVNTDEVSLHACRFDENTTRIREHYLSLHPDATTLTADDLWDAHYRIGYRSGLNTGDRARTLDYVRKIHKKTAYERRLQVICRSSLLYKLYLSYRKKHLKKSRLDMYFGN